MCGYGIEMDTYGYGCGYGYECGYEHGIEMDTYGHGYGYRECVYGRIWVWYGIEKVCMDTYG